MEKDLLAVLEKSKEMDGSGNEIKEKTAELESQMEQKSKKLDTIDVVNKKEIEKAVQEKNEKMLF